MAIAFDAFTSGGIPSTSPLSWSHVPSGTPRGVVVLVIQDAGSNESVAVTYGGNTMTPLTVIDGSALAEPGWIYPFWLGSSIPAGSQTVTWTDTGAAQKGAISYTVTAAADVAIEDESSGTGTGANPSFTLTTGASVETMCFSAIFSGAGTHTNVTAGASWTKDLGSNAYTGQSGCFEHLTSTDAGSDVSVDWTVTAATWVAYAIALKEVTGTTETPSFGGAIASAVSPLILSLVTIGGAIASGLAPSIPLVGQVLYPDADIDTGGWTVTPLWSKVEEEVADGTIIQATAS